MQLRLYVETTNEDSHNESAYLRYFQDMFWDGYHAFEEDVKERGQEITTHVAKLEHGW